MKKRLPNSAELLVLLALTVIFFTFATALPRVLDGTLRGVAAVVASLGTAIFGAAVLTGVFVIVQKLRG